ncbi:PfkB family carbohydrate kinase [Bosea sp. CCNWLW174]|uniref:PfkB family carbohydrate kinase n=1 Tax=unclassified Bosea (in: a-proteobacteria) TaxID=2653178 RepID=UPI0030143DF0
MYGFDFVPDSAPQRITFDYVHPLSVPVIRPALVQITALPPLSAEGDVVLRFGMLEGTAVVSAHTCIYDPQSAFSPERFSANGSRAERLAVVANRSEIQAMGGAGDIGAAARAIIAAENAEVVVVKCGADGAVIVCPDGANYSVPAYRSDGAFTIGSGDVFAAVFAASWGVQGKSPAEAAHLASLAVSEYVGSRALPSRQPEQLAASTSIKLVAQPGEVYLAGPFFSMSQRWLIEEARRCLAEVGMTVLSPFHDIGPGPAGEVAPADIAALQKCDVVFAVLEGLDSGTLFEVGYARAIGKPVYGFAQTVAYEDLKMVIGTGCIVHSDFTTAIHHLAWRA